MGKDKNEADDKYVSMTDEELEKIMMLRLGQFSENSGKEAQRIQKILKERKMNTDKS